ncbi:MAG: hypothetical protein RTV31_11175 [Candidatus Thorarchaeota archaeon]
MEESTTAPEISRLCITKTWFSIWIISSCIVILACYLNRPLVRSLDEFTVLINAVNVIAYVLALGFPVFLPAGIVFGTTKGKENIFRLLQSGKKPALVFLRCLAEVYGLVLVFSIVVSGVLFYEPFLVGTVFSEPIGTGFLIYLSPVIIATLIVSLVLASIGVIFVMITDEFIISTTMGSALTIGLATLLGWNSREVYYSVLKGQAILSPSNLVRIFAGKLSNYVPGDGRFSFEYFRSFGFNVSMDSILLVLAMFGSIILIGFIASVKILQRNSSIWVNEREIRKIGIWETEQEHKQKIVKIRRRIVKRSSVLVSLIIIVLIVASIGTTSYTNLVINNTTVIFHQSPETGEQINLGDWNIFSCDVQPAQFDLPNIIHYNARTEDWMIHDCPDELTFFYAMLNMSSLEFQNFNETERRAQCSSLNTTSGTYGRGGAFSLGSYYGSLAYVLKVIATENETTTGFIYSRIVLFQSPTF